ncbi:Alpha/beta hydrolase fold [Trema orientale]|uniref:Alpha/beta hydrolase fold n=1 Tax=Trema orientale TaxID=63057 RepID=A0A2P5EKJ5_TREOI|nr:Alpha/beta hydrolase fold [Trema orientale]
MVGMRPQRVEIQPGTLMNFWVPTEKTKGSSSTTVQANDKRPKKAVVFLHGFAADGIFNWQFQVLSLANKYAVYVPDFLFFGDSITDSTDRSPSFQAACVAKGLGKLGVEKCTLVGLSYGGMVGFKMAQLFPDLVESMVVSCSVMALTASVSSDSLRRIGFKSWSDCLLPETVEGVKAMFDVGTYKLPNVPDWIYRQFLEVMFDNRKEKKELLEALVVSDNDFIVPHYPQRVALLWGQNDKIFNMETASNLKTQLGERATLESIEKAGHLVPLERPCVYNNNLKKILASLLEE